MYRFVVARVTQAAQGDRVDRAVHQLDGGLEDRQGVAEWHDVVHLQLLVRVAHGALELITGLDPRPLILVEPPTTLVVGRHLTPPS